MEPSAKRACSRQTTLFGRVAETNEDIYKTPVSSVIRKFVNAFIRRDRRAGGSREALKKAADAAWKAWGVDQRQKLISSDLAEATSKSAVKVIDYGFSRGQRTLPAVD